ncbi:MAG: Cupin 2 protein [Chloroflexi bacterium]|nr:Cupin 2 protein [Chloroflexota bacterium]
MAETTAVQPRDANHLSNTPDSSRFSRQMLTTQSWQIASVPTNAVSNGERSFIGLTTNRFSDVNMNVYEPGKRDEMHCHPGSEHIFLVHQGELTLRGINEGEQMVLKPGEFVHVKAGHYYQLANETDAVTVLFQVATNPPKKSPVSRRSFRRAGDLKASDLVQPVGAIPGDLKNSN